MFVRLLGWYTIYIYIFGGSCSRNGILPGAKFTVRTSLPLSYIDRVTAEHSTSGRQPNFAAWCLNSRDRAAIPFDIGRSSCLVSITFQH